MALQFPTEFHGGWTNYIPTSSIQNSVPHRSMPPFAAACFLNGSSSDWNRAFESL